MQIAFFRMLVTTVEDVLEPALEYTWAFCLPRVGASLEIEEIACGVCKVSVTVVVLPFATNLAYACLCIEHSMSSIQLECFLSLI